MPHPNSTHWQQQLWGRPVPFDPPTSVQKLVERRNRHPQDTERFTTGLPDVAEFHEHVTMRPEPGRTPTAEIYVPHG